MVIKHTLKAKVFLSIAILYSLAILFLSLVNLQKVEIIKLEASDKIYHAGCYCLMVLLWSLFTKSKSHSYNLKIKSILFVSISLFGIIIEYLQLYLTNYRAFDWWDVLANCIGVFVGILIFSALQKLFN